MPIRSQNLSKLVLVYTRMRPWHIPFSVVITMVMALNTECANGVPRKMSAVGTVIKGGIYFDKIWTPKGSPYILSGSVKVGKGTTVKVLPGVRIEGHGNKITVDGKFVTYGSSEKIVFITDTHFIAGKYDVGVIDLRHTDVSGGSILSPRFFDGHKASVNITDSTLSHVSDEIYIFYPPFNMTFSRNVFYKCGGISVGTEGIVVTIRNNLFFRQTTPFAVKNWARMPFVIDQEDSHDGKNYWYPHDMKVKHNSFLCNDQVALRLEPRYNDAYMREAQSNYFGTVNGDAVAGMIYDRRNTTTIHSKVAYEPFLTAPHPLTPERPEFICDDPDA